MPVKDVIVIGGPNGAGKTTAANRLLPTTLGLHEFLNADEIARHGARHRTVEAH